MYSASQAISHAEYNKRVASDELVAGDLGAAGEGESAGEEAEDTTAEDNDAGPTKEGAVQRRRDAVEHTATGQAKQPKQDAGATAGFAARDRSRDGSCNTPFREGTDKSALPMAAGDCATPTSGAEAVDTPAPAKPRHSEGEHAAQSGAEQT